MDKTRIDSTIRCRGNLQLGARQSTNGSAKFSATPDEIRIDSPLRNIVLSRDQVKVIEQVTCSLFKWSWKCRAFRIVNHRPSDPASVIFRFRGAGTKQTRAVLEGLRSLGYNVP
jgi:hypothetical protein